MGPNHSKLFRLYLYQGRKVMKLGSQNMIIEKVQRTWLSKAPIVMSLFLAVS